MTPREAGDKVAQIQGILGVDTDRIWGPKTQKALESLVLLSRKPYSDESTQSAKVRQRFVDIARTHVGKTETSKNQGAWILPLWSATSYGPAGYHNREPYCATGLAWSLRELVAEADTQELLGMTAAQAETWRCKSASVFRAGDSWSAWAAKKGIAKVDKNAHFRVGDIVIYSFSHIELVSKDSASGSFMAVGYNTNAAGDRDGEGCFEKFRNRSSIKEVIRIFP